MAASKPARLSLRREDDENVALYLGRKLIVAANHDEHGWAGMELVEATAKSLSQALALPLEEK